MKKFFIALIASTGLLFSISSFAQTVTGTIVDVGSNSATVYGKPTSGIANQVGNINICISIPDQTLSAGTNPTDAQITKVVNVTNGKIDNGTIVNPTIIGDRAYYTYLIFQDAGTDASANWTANVDNAIITFTFPNSGYLTDLRLVDRTVDNGGPNGQMYWYVQFNTLGDVTDYTAPFYGDGAVNNGGSSEQFVPVQITNVPVRFLGFSATKVDNAALLNWQIENESAKTVSYEIERSTNGVDFVKIATVLAKNNGSSSNAYEITDNGIASLSTASVAYYRVKQIDVDGKFVYTTIKSIRLNSKAMLVGVYPNPVKNNANLTIDITEDKMISLQITDATGKEIRRSQFQVVKGINNKKIEMNGLSAGNYLFKIIAGEEIKTIPVIKAN